MSRWDCDGWLVGRVDRKRRNCGFGRGRKKGARGYICGGERGLRGHTYMKSALTSIDLLFTNKHFTRMMECLRKVQKIVEVFKGSPRRGRPTTADKKCLQSLSADGK